MEARWESAGGLCWLEPDWPVAAHVRVRAMTRIGGDSEDRWAGLNLSLGVGDVPSVVAQNRARLASVFGLPKLSFPHQVHSTAVTEAQCAEGSEADVVLARAPGQVCALLTADCLPVFLAARDGRAVAVAHAGWRGLADGVLESAIAALQMPPEDVCAWLGPGIGANVYEVGEDFYQCFQTRLGSETDAALIPSGVNRWHADLYALARVLLLRAGVQQIDDSGCCTHSDAEHFYSYRRDGQTGRQGNLIWLDTLRA